MKSKLFITAAILALLSFYVDAQSPFVYSSDPAEVFINPPENAKPGVLWMLFVEE